MNADIIFYKQWVTYAFFFYIAAMSAAIFFAKKREGRNERETLENGNKSVTLDVSNADVSIAQPIGSGPWLWLLATFIWLIGKLKNYELFYLYLYFYAAGFIPIAYSSLSYCKLSRKGAILFYGSFFNRESFQLNWKDVEKISQTDKTSAKKRGQPTVGCLVVYVENKKKRQLGG